MCGIVGVAGNISMSANKMFRDMLIFDTVRGVDSTGVLSVPLKTNFFPKQPIIEKEVGLPDALWDKPNSSIFNYMGKVTGVHRVLLGHNRAATVGKVNVENAHPFNFDDIYGVHNGSLRSYSDLDNYAEHSVDSMCLFDTINNKGIEHTWKSFYGAAALVWWDHKEDKLNFIRNTERPLWVAFNKAKDMIIWASEPWMIRIAASRNGVELDKDDKGASNICYFEEDYHYQYEIGNTHCKVLPRKKLEKKQHQHPQTIGTTTNGYAAGPAGFKGQNNTTKYKVARKGQLNQGWASDMDRADKDSRGLLIEITHKITDGSKFIGKFVREQGIYKGIVHVYPNDHKEIDQLEHSLKTGNNRFKTAARMRFVQRGTYTLWGISSKGIKPVVKAGHPSLEVINGGKEEKPVDICTFRSYQGVYVSEGKWKELLSSGPGNYCGCAYCGDTLYPRDHKEILFLTKNDALCPACSTNNGVLEQMYELYPELDYKTN